MPNTGTIEDRLAIRELIERYCDGVTQRDADIWGSTWAQDSVWSLPVVPGMEAVTGKDMIVAAWLEAMKLFPFVFMSSSIGFIRIEGDRAYVRSYTSEVADTADGKMLRPRGQYDDVVVKQNGQWLFEKRVFNVLHGE